MRTIHLLQNDPGKWFVHVTSGGDIVSVTQPYKTPASAARQFVSEGRNQPYARMVVHAPGGRLVPIRKARPFPKGDFGAVVDAEQIRKAMKRGA